MHNAQASPYAVPVVLNLHHHQQDQDHQQRRLSRHLCTQNLQVDIFDMFSALYYYAAPTFQSHPFIARTRHQPDQRQASTNNSVTGGLFVLESVGIDVMVVRPTGWQPSRRNLPAFFIATVKILILKQTPSKHHSRDPNVGCFGEHGDTIPYDAGSDCDGV